MVSYGCKIADILTNVVNIIGSYDAAKYTQKNREVSQVAERLLMKFSQCRWYMYFAPRPCM